VIQKKLTQCDRAHIGLPQQALLFSTVDRELAMSQSHLTRWIENAEARRFSETVMIDSSWSARATHNDNVGGPLAQLSSWLHAHIHYPRFSYRH
jgi:hypothetical protein